MALPESSAGAGLPAVPAALPGSSRVALRAPVFISDLHLSAARPRTLERFVALAEQVRGTGHELLILGDLFEFWAGDDTLGQDAPDDEVARQVVAALARLAGAGSPVYVLHGNRDLLLGADFLRASGARLLADPCVAECPAADTAPLLLSHGDAYCTRDLPYQAFRRQARDARFQAAFLARPLAERRAVLGQARAQSEAGKQQMAQEIMDVTEEAIDAALRAAGVQHMIHGHTHRPACHQFTLDGRPATRRVLPDWEMDGPGAARGGGLRLQDGRLVAFAA